MIPEPMSPVAQDLLELEKARPSVLDPKPEAIERLLRRLESELALAPSVGATPPPTSAAVPAVAGKLGLGLLMLAAGALSGSGITALVMRAPAEPMTPVVVQPLAAPQPATVELEPTPQAPLVPAPPLRVRSAARVETSNLPAEQPLLDIARAAIVNGRPDSALEALDRHASAFPKGALSEEREAMAIQALVQRGDAEAARTRATAFRKRFPHSILLPAVDSVAPQ